MSDPRARCGAMIHEQLSRAVHDNGGPASPPCPVLRVTPLRPLRSKRIQPVDYKLNHTVSDRLVPDTSM